ncbi:hypothetical protein MOV66_22685 [Agrobacterium sp. SHOUNA12C]|nr:hypothetical protein [Rhizobium rhizogenes]MCJ9723877.1 hypothetical protein [Agrobacterium sp. BETTINA12B]MCJ9759469.1 hypothetical protein [Agrobacterium sp. SHOUNA12C]
MLTWLTRIFGKDRKVMVTDVMDAYAALLEGHPSSIMDVGMLPEPKADMKILLKTLYGTTSDPKLQSALTMGFMFLAQFQEGIGPVPVDPIPVDGDFAIAGPVPTEQEIEKLRCFALELDTGKMERFIFWQRAVAKESNNLHEEWTDFLNGDPIQ